MTTNKNYQMIVAMNEDGIIGIDNKLPWYIPDDLRRFKRITSGHIVIMGRKTFESLPNGPLPNRINIVLTRDYEKYQSTDTLHFIDYQKVFSLIENLKETTNKKIFIIGGEEIYNLFLNDCSTIYVTIVYKKLEILPEHRYFPISIEKLQNDYISVKENDEVIVGDHCYCCYYIFSKKG